MPDLTRDDPVDLEPGDVLYQADQELFLVVTAVNEASYDFAVHGWREIDAGRLGEYLDGESGQLYDRETVAETIAEHKGSETQADFESLMELLSGYADGVTDDGPHTTFALDDTQG